MVEQLAAISSQSNHSRKEFIMMDEAFDLSGLDDWEEATKHYLEDLKTGVWTPLTVDTNIGTIIKSFAN